MLLVPKRLRRWSMLITTGIAMLLLAACGVADPPMTTFSKQGYESEQILYLFWPIFWMAIAVFAVVEGALIYSVVRYRRRVDNEGIPLQLHGNTSIELAWTIIPAILVLVIAVWTFRTQARLERVPSTPLEVTVIGHQWWWEFRYPEYGIVTANELHLPVDRDALFTLQSADVIHSFHVPRLVGTTDAIPGHENRVVVRPQEAVRELIRGHCKEFCGGTHAMMAMHVAVQPQAEFDAWVQHQQQPAPVPAGVQQATSGQSVSATVAATATGVAAVGDEVAATTVATVEPTANATTTPVQQNAQAETPAARGYQLFASKGCVGCHAIAGRPDAVGVTAPNLTHVGSREHIVAGWLENTPENIRRWLRNPNEVKPENVMGAVIKRGTLTEDEIGALTAYLESLK